MYTFFRVFLCIKKILCVIFYSSVKHAFLCATLIKKEEILTNKFKKMWKLYKV